MSSPLHTLDTMEQALQACQQGQLAQRDLIQHWRAESDRLPLPKRFGEVLGGLLDRMEASALFSEESCSFSQRDLLDGLQLWADKARPHCMRPAEADSVTPKST